VVAGCGPQLDPAEFAGIPGVRWVVGNRAKASLAEEIDRWLAEGPVPDAPPRVQWAPDPTASAFPRREAATPLRRTRALLKVQDGCDLGCAYCVVPRLRGRPVSRDPADALEEARRLTEAGAREIVVTGINLGLYGRDTGGGLVPLLRRLLDTPGLERLRLSSLEPMTIDGELLDLLGASPRLCPHLHVPLQSGDDAVLRRMGRPYDAAAFRRLVERIAGCRERVGLGVDVLAGFPGESEAAFAATLALIESLPVTYLHAFAFSPRPGTPAAALPGQVPPQVRRARVAELRALDARLRRRFRERLRGRRVTVLVERVRRGEYEGWAGEYVRVRGRSAEAAAGEPLEVVL
jgi:threonylcarbamoyladenosine tRNA methylthiotransferase MtaB